MRLHAAATVFALIAAHGALAHGQARTRGAPVVLGIGHAGDQAAIVYSSSSEFATFIGERCK